MARRGAGRTKRRDKPTSPPSTSSPKKSPAKRQKTTGGRAGRPTPFVSWSTGKEFVYDRAAQEPYTFLKITPVTDHEVPPSAFAFLQESVKPFSTELNDIYVSPKCIVISFTMDADKIPLYWKFVQPGKIQVPNTDCCLQVRPQQMEKILTTLYGITFDDESDGSLFNEELSSSESSDSELDTTFLHQGQTKNAVSDNSPKSAIAPNQDNALQPFTSPLLPAMDLDTQPAMELDAQPANSTSVSPPAVPMESSHVPPTPKGARQQEQLALRRRARARFSKVDFAKLDVVVPKEDFLTILLRPTKESDSLHKANPYKITAELIKLGGHPIRTRNIREGGLAVDFAPETPSQPLLKISCLMMIPVTASLPKVAVSCNAVLSSVHWEISEEQISTDLRTEPPLKVIAVKRLAKPGQQSWTVKVTFQGTTLPTRAFLEGRSHRVRPYETKPLQCFKCGRFSHTARVCRSQINCWTCSGNHEAQDCPNKATPKCGNCGGPHPVDDKTCPTRNFQQKVAQVKAAENVSFKSAREAVSKAAKSYASAVKSSFPAQPSKRQQPPASLPNYISNIAHPRPPKQQVDLTVLFNGLVAILTAAATTKDFAGALAEVLRLFQSNSSNPDDFQLPV